MAKRNREKTREKIVKGAVALLTRTGFKDFGINSVAREAECDKVLLYRYFGDLDGLLAAMAESVQFFPDPDRFLRVSVGESVQFFPDPDRFLRVSVGESEFRTEAERLALLLYAYAKELRERPLTAQMINWFGMVENPMVDACDNARRDFEAVLLEEGDSSTDDRNATRLKIVSLFIKGLASECGKADLDDLEEWKPVFRQMGESLWPSGEVHSGFEDDEDDSEYGMGWEKKRSEEDDFPFSLF